MLLRCLYNRLVIKKIDNRPVSSDGLALPANPHQHSNHTGNIGEVISIGSGRRFYSGEFSPMSVNVGDWVIYRNNSGQEFKVGDDDYLILSESSMLALVEKDV